MPVHPYFPGGGSGSSDGAVTSVNGEQGDVVLSAQDIQAQPVSSVLSDIAAITMPDNSFLMVGSTGIFAPATCMPAGVAWLGYSTVDQQKAHLAYSTVASTGRYSDLLDKPSIPATQVNSDWNSTSGVSQVLNKPVLFSGAYTDLTGKPVLFTGNYADLNGKPALFDGAYSSLTGKPAIPSAQIQSDWNQTNTASLDFIKNKPVIPSVNYPVTSVNTKTGAVVLTASDVGAIATGAPIAYSTLTGTPTIPAAQVNSDWTAVSGVSQILNKPSLSTVATTGSYADLTNKPLIPSVNYPVTSVNTKVGAVVLTNTDVGAAASVHTHTISDVTGLQSSLDSKATTASLSGYATTSALTTATTGLRKVETFLGTSDASGNFSITFANTYATTPDVQPQIIGGTFNQSVRVVSVSNTGCVVQAAQRNVVTLLSVEVLLGATVNLAGASITVQVTTRA